LIVSKGHKKFPLFFALILTFSFLFNAALYVTSMYQGIFHFMMSLGILVLLPHIKLPQIIKNILWGLTFIVLGLHYSFDILSTVNYLCSPKIEYPQIQNYVQKHPELTYIIDDYAARFAFNYQLPSQTISWTFANKAPNFWLVSPEQIPENTVMIASLFRANYLESIKEVPNLPDWPRLKILGYQVNSIARYPQEIIIFPETIK
ncbi:MAG: hypothetical protein SAJ12_21390, partial [Jaaginema sp. PMC 1079.18]|nr:hypothetical protein [Jaaginema sp. PMC 1079.18]